MRVWGIIICVFLVQGISYAQADTVVWMPVPGSLVSANAGNVNAQPSSVATYTIHITVTDIRNKDGVLRFKFYDDSSPFPDLHGFLKVVVSKSAMKADSLTLTVHGVPSRHMGIALLDDENNNIKLDMGWFLPKEGHAFSDYYHAAIRRPVYDDFDFFLTADKWVVMRMKYY